MIWPNWEYLSRASGQVCRSSFPGSSAFISFPTDMVSQILNFGLPAPIDIQVTGKDLEGNRRFADNLLEKIRYIPGTTDLRIQQPFNQPILSVKLDRTKSNQVGYTALDIADNILVFL